ncbi:GntR family transcriptional regulator [uncultured Roseibium sp.]|uniref:GntR family transcriptional regulator n=1 Tax=uncultured Roseibium sp. TaxID=1936171 RepID=UPI00261246C9|nr:GntR family transcriptional regulator [uncultured Roseibium sp.]
MLFSDREGTDATIVAMLSSAIRRDISFGVLRPDERLKIEALRQRYGGSNHSMRETLRILAAEGMVEATNQRGFRVTSATDDDLQDILLMRIETERLGLKRSLRNGNVAWESRVVAAFHGLHRADVTVQETLNDAVALDWDEASRVLSAALLSACGSRRLIETANKFYNQSRRYLLALLREGQIDFAVREKRHQLLREAILARNDELALSTLEEDIRAALQTT